MKNRTIKATPNYSARTFTIRTGTQTHRTVRLSKEEFNSLLNNTSRDWEHFLKTSSDYYNVK